MIEDCTGASAEIPRVCPVTRSARQHPSRPFYRLAVRTYLLLASALVVPAAAQEAPPRDPSPGSTLRVFLDCGACDFDHIRQEIPFVAYVRDPAQADVHVFVTAEETGGDGIQYQLSFLGRDEYATIEYSFERTVDRDATSFERRAAVTEAVRLGLVPYAVQTLAAADFSAVYSGEVDAGGGRQPARDPWRHWVFTAYVGDIQLDLESNRTVFDSRWGFFADHVSETWKLRVRPYFNYDFVRIEREDEPDVTSSIRRHGLDTYALRSLGPHWSIGAFADYITFNGQNLRHRFRGAPAVEYSLLPYDQATRRAVTFVYQLEIAYADYFEETIFNRTEEWLLSQQLSASVAFRQPWGEVFAGLEGSHYFHDLSKRRAELDTYASVRLFEGLSLRLGGSLEMVQDQLSLPLGEATIEEILLRQRELATDYELSFSVALTYSFGSEFTNIVNTRFD